MLNINLDEIDIYNIGTWPNIMKAAVIIVANLAIIFIFKWLFIDSKVEELDNLIAEEKRLKVFFVSRHKLLVNITEYKAQMKEIQDRLSTLVQLLPSANEIPNLVNQVSLAGKDSGLTFKEITILPEKQFKYYVELPIKIKVNGNYHQMGEFISKVSGLPRIITLHDLTLAPDKTKVAEIGKIRSVSNSQEYLELDVLAKTYRYLTKPPGSENVQDAKPGEKTSSPDSAVGTPAGDLSKPAAGG